MPNWSWFLVALLFGAALLAGATLLDRRTRRQFTGAGQPAPLRGNPAVDAQVPRYLTQDDIDAMPSPADGPGITNHPGEGFGFGHAHPDFATSRDGADWPGPRLLVVDGAVTAMRELLPALAMASAEQPLVVVADSFADEVLTTLAANRRALRMPVVAAVATAQERRRLAELTGAWQLNPSDLQAGYLPCQGFGQAARWISTGTQCWVEPTG